MEGPQKQSQEEEEEEEEEELEEGPPPGFQCMLPQEKQDKMDQDDNYNDATDEDDEDEDDDDDDEVKGPPPGFSTPSSIIHSDISDVKAKNDHEKVEDEDGPTPGQKIPAQPQLPSTFNVEAEKEAEQEAAAETADLFQKLPDELVMQIIDKVCEAKWLCMLYMTSKRNAHLVTKISSVNLKVPHWTIGNQPPWYILAVAVPMTHYFLSKLTCVETFHVEVVLPQPEEGVNDDGDEYITRWKAMGDQDIFLFFAAKKVTDAETTASMTNAGNDEQRETIRSICSKVRNYIKDSRRRYDLLCLVTRALPSLKKAEVTDSTKQGTLGIADVDIKKVRRSSESKRRKKWTVIFESLWHKDVVKLPSPSGLVIHGATLGFVTSYRVDEASTPVIEAGLAEDAFEEKEYCEAGKELVKQRPYHWVVFGDFVESFTQLYDHPVFLRF